MSGPADAPSNLASNIPPETIEQPTIKVRGQPVDVPGGMSGVGALDPSIAPIGANGEPMRAVPMDEPVTGRTGRMPGATQPGINRLTGKPFELAPSWDQMTPDQQAAVTARQLQQAADAAQGAENAKQYWANKPANTRGLKESFAESNNESTILSESQIFLIIGKIVERQRKLNEGIMDTVKGAAGKAMNWAQTKGTNLTTKVTADKLLQAWKKAGSPTDSLDVASIIQKAGVPSDSIKQVYTTMQIPFAGEKGAGASTKRNIDVDPSSVAPGAPTSAPTASAPSATANAPAADASQAAPAATGSLAQAQELIAKLDPETKTKLISTLKQELSVAESRINELSTNKLAQYKTASAADAKKADSEGDYKRGDKRFSGIVRATNKQFANDTKKHGQQGVAEGWRDEADDFNEWSDYVRERLTKASPEQRPGLASQLSQLEVKHFGSSTHAGFNKETGKPIAGVGLTDTVRRIVKSFSKEADDGRRAQAAIDGTDGPAGNFSMPFGSVDVAGLEGASPEVLRVMKKAVMLGADVAAAARNFYKKHGTLTDQDLPKIQMSLANDASSEWKQQHSMAEGDGPRYIDNMMNQYKAGLPDQNPAALSKPTRAVDARGRTQEQWAQLVRSKFPGAKITQAKMIDGPMQATLPDGRKLGWKKVEQIDELNCWSGYHRVAGTKAGFPGSCAKNKTNEEGVAEEEDKMDSRFKKTEWMPLMDAIKILKHYGATPEKYMGHEMFPYYDIEGNRKYLEDITWNADNSKNVRVSLVNQAVRELKAQKQGVAEEQHSCPHCGGEMVSEELMNEKKDACYYKVKSRYKVWPSAYASGALVKCRKSGADSWGNGGKKNEGSILEGINRADESLHDWFNKEKWVRMDTKGKIKGPCAREPGEGKPKCLPQAKAHSLGKKGRASAAARKRREDPNPERSGKAINVNTKKKD
jgi:hypothetical protein